MSLGFDSPGGTIMSPRKLYSQTEQSSTLQISKRQYSYVHWWFEMPARLATICLQRHMAPDLLLTSLNGWQGIVSKDMCVTMAYVW